MLGLGKIEIARTEKLQGLQFRYHLHMLFPGPTALYLQMETASPV